METRSINSLTEYAKYKIKVCFLNSIFLVLGILASLFISIESIIHMRWINDGILILDRSNFFIGLFSSLMIVFFVLALGFAIFIIYLIYVIITQNKIIKYYREPRFSLFVTKEIDYDYKLWQTAPKNTFHSMVISIELDGESFAFKTPIIFTNSKRIGFFKIPLVLQSHSYVRNKCVIGYDIRKKEAVIIEIV